MKTSSTFVFTLLLGVFFTACNTGGTEQNQQSTQTNAETASPQNLYEGTGFSIEITGFDIEASKTSGEIRNGYDKAVRDMRGYLYFLDAEGNEITFANGTIKREPFQRVQNPFIVDAKRTSATSFGNQIDKRADKVFAVVSEITFTDGSQAIFD